MTDFTSMWVFLQKYNSQLRFGLVIVVTFLLGWQAGQIMAPYNAAHPIIFEDRECSVCASSGGDAQELEMLKAEGIAARQPATADIAVDNQAGTFVASVNSNLYHHPDCGAAKQIKPENIVRFASTSEAQAAGYSPSVCTLDKLGIRR